MVKFGSGSRGDWNQIKARLGQRIEAPLDFPFGELTGNTRINISEESTRNRIGLLVGATKPYIDRGLDDEILLAALYGITPTQELFSRFSLAVGSEVYENRRYILNQLKLQSNGQRCFQLLMKSLAWFERGNDRPQKPFLPSYNRYPQTIEQGEKYFLMGAQVLH